MQTTLADMSCEQGAPLLTPAQARDYLDVLDSNWALSADVKTVSRRFEFKGFAKAVYFSNLAVFLADQQNHHPDISFGWGYCAISFTTHDRGGLTVNDFICAAKLDLNSPG